MKTRKILAVIMALTLCMGMAVTAFAATGYSSESDVYVERDSKDSSSSGWSPGGGVATAPSGSTSNSSNTATSSTEYKSAPVTSKVAEAAAEKAFQSGGSVVSVTNPSNVTSAAFKAVAESAVKAGVENPTINADNKLGNLVFARAYVPAEAAAKLGKNLDLSVDPNPKNIDNGTKKAIDGLVEGKYEAIQMGQKGAFGIDIPMAVSVKMFPGINPENMKLSVYDPIEKKVVELKVVVKDNYAYFTTPVGGTLIAQG